MLREKLERREKVAQCLLKGYPEYKIAEELGVSRRTVVNDVAYLKKAVQPWLDNLAKTGFIFEYKQGLDIIRANGIQLQKLSEETSDKEVKLKILKAIDDNAKLYLEVLAGVPTISSIRKAIGAKSNLV